MSFSFECQVAAYKLLKDIMTVRAKETVVIYSDTASDEEVVKATASAAAILKATPILVTMPTNPKGFGDYPRALRELFKAADVVIEMGGGSLILYTSTYDEVIAAGKARFLCLPNITRELFWAGIGKVDVKKTLELGDKLVELTSKAKMIRVTSPAGTNLVARMNGRKASQWGNLASKPTQTVLLLGQVGWNPLEDTINGTIVFDGTIDRPKIMIPESSIRLTVKKGFIVDFQGGPEALSFKNWLASWNNKNMHRVSHYTYGLNPGILDLSGKSITADERLFGCFLFGFGNQVPFIGGGGYKAPAHADGICLNPSVWLDDVQIEREGKWVHPKLVQICKEMKVPGY